MSVVWRGLFFLGLFSYAAQLPARAGVDLGLIKTSFAEKVDTAASEKFDSNVVLEMVSLDRINQRRNYFEQMIIHQGYTRKITTAGLVTVALLGLGGVVWYVQQNTEQSEHKKKQRPSTGLSQLEHKYFQQKLAEFEEMQTAGGIIKKSVRNGFGYAVATVATMAVLNLFDKCTNISFSRIREVFYPKTVDFFEQYSDFLKANFDFLYESLQKLGREQAQIATEKQLETFIQWRQMLASDVETNVSTMIKIVEDFAALSLCVLERVDTSEQRDAVAHCVNQLDKLLVAVNKLSTVLSAVINASTLEQLAANRTDVGLYFKQAVFAAKMAMQSLVDFVEVS